MDPRESLKETFKRYDQEVYFEYLKLCVDIPLENNAFTYVMLSQFLTNTNISKNHSKLILNECYDVLFLRESYNIQVDNITKIPLKIYEIFEKHGIDLNEQLKSTKIRIENVEITTFIRNFINQFREPTYVENARNKSLIPMGNDLSTSIQEGSGNSNMKKRHEIITMDVQKLKEFEENRKFKENFDTVMNTITRHSPMSGTILLDYNIDQKLYNFLYSNKSILEKKKDIIKRFIILLMCGILSNMHISSISFIHLEIENTKIITEQLYDDKTRYPSTYLIKTVTDILNQATYQNNDFYRRIRKNWTDHYLKYSIDAKNYIKLMKEKGCTDESIKELQNNLKETSDTIENLFTKDKIFKDITGIKKNELNEYFQYVNNPNQVVISNQTIKQVQQDIIEDVDYTFEDDDDEED